MLTQELWTLLAPAELCSPVHRQPASLRLCQQLRQQPLFHATACLEHAPFLYLPRPCLRPAPNSKPALIKRYQAQGAPRGAPQRRAAAHTHAPRAHPRPCACRSLLAHPALFGGVPAEDPAQHQRHSPRVAAAAYDDQAGFQRWPQQQQGVAVLPRPQRPQGAGCCKARSPMTPAASGGCYWARPHSPPATLVVGCALDRPRASRHRTMALTPTELLSC